MPASHLSAYKLKPSEITSTPEKWLNQEAYETYLQQQKPNLLAGQARACIAIEESLQSSSPYSHAYLALPIGLMPQDTIQSLSSQQNWQIRQQFDWVYLANPNDSLQPICVWLPRSTAEQAIKDLVQFLQLAPGQRSEAYQQIQSDYPSTSFSQYLKLMQDKTFEELPGNELATVLVSHSQRGTPWIYCDEVTETSLFGSIHVQSVEGTVSSELHLIKAGAIHRANGGVLFIDAAELVVQPKLWKKLKTILKRQSFHWSLPNKGETPLFYEPEPIPLDLKVVLIGTSPLFTQLNELDSDFSNYFPYLADFTLYYSPQKEGISGYLDFLTYLRDQIGHRPFSYTGLLALLSYTAYLCEHQEEFSLDAVRIIQFLEEVERFAKKENSPFIEATHISQAEQTQRARFAKTAELNWQSILEEQVYISTKGQEIGQINGLTVVSEGGIEFGEPSRITASVHLGDGDIIDIERKSELSGNIHTKGVMILSAYLARLFAQKEPLPLSATLVFEQSYHEVDGDSASLAELCCLLSALSDTPILQSIAVTGAIDQFGRVQAVGGINEKIEGFYEICKTRGLTGEQGVILPASNKLNLHLPHEIIEAVQKGQFHLYKVQHVTEAVEILMGVDCGNADEVTQNTLFGRILQRLLKLHGLDSAPTGFLQRIKQFFTN